VFVVYEMRRHVFPTAPSPTTTHLMPLAAMWFQSRQRKRAVFAEITEYVSLNDFLESVFSPKYCPHGSSTSRMCIPALLTTAR
jgi:hypothetical protein